MSEIVPFGGALAKRESRLVRRELSQMEGRGRVELALSGELLPPGVTPVLAVLGEPLEAHPAHVAADLRGAAVLVGGRQTLALGLPDARPRPLRGIEEARLA